MTEQSQYANTTVAICDNESVGVLITDTSGRYLMFERVKPPYGLAPVAGHKDNHATGETAACVEVAEEVGLTVTALRPLIVEWRANRCRRPAGALGHGHNWTIYQATTSGTVHVGEQEACHPRWLTPAEIQTLAEHTAAYALGQISDRQWQSTPGIEPIWVGFLNDLNLVDLAPRELHAIDELTHHDPDVRR